MCWPRERQHSFNPLGAPIRRRHAAGATRPRPAAGQASIDALFVFAVLWGALSPFVLRVVAGACVGRGSGPRMPPRERQHEGLGVGGFNPLRGAGAGAPIRRRHAAGATRQAVLMRFLFLRFCGGALSPFVLRVVAGACVGRGSGQPRMPPRERQHEGLGVGGFNPLRGAGAGAPIRRRHAAGATRPRPAAGQASIDALFVFAVLWRGAVAVCFEGCCGSQRLTTGVVRHACRHRVTARGVLIFWS